MKRMFANRLARFVLAAAAIFLLSGAAVGAGEVLSIAPLGAIKAEEGSETSLDVLRKVTKSAAEFAGFEVKDAKLAGEGRDAVLGNAKKLVESGKLDVVAADVEVMKSLREGGIPMAPFVTIEVSGATSYRECFFVRKADKEKTLKDFRGAVVGGWGYNVMRKMLYDAGIDEPVDKFFGEIRWIDGMHPKWIVALDKKEIDGFMAGIIGMGLAIATNPVVAKQVTSLSCVDGLKPLPAIAVRKNLPEGTKKKLLDAFMSKDGKSNLDRKYAFFTKNLRWKFVPAGAEWDKAFKNFKDFSRLAAEKGWDKEPFWNK